MGMYDTSEILGQSEKLSSTAWENVFVFSHSTVFHSMVSALPTFLELFSWKIFY